MDQGQHVVIVGGGFGGLYLAKALKRAPVQITLIDQRNFHLFQPLLYQVATGTLSPANIAAPLRSILKRQKNARVLLAEVIDVDVAGKRVVLSDGAVPYDLLVIATGSHHSYFGNDHWGAVAPGLKTIEDATEIRTKLYTAFEEAERAEDPGRVRHLLTFVIIGAGPTGVELAGALSEIARHTLPREFRTIDPGDARIVLVESMDQVLPLYPPDLSAKAREALEKLGVEVRTGARVTDVSPDGVRLTAGGEDERIHTGNVIWAAGVKASPLGEVVARRAGVETDRVGRVRVGPDLALPGYPEVFVIGDLALTLDDQGRPLPGIAPVAIQQGHYVAKVVEARRRGNSLPPFRYRDYGAMATIGRSKAVADFGRLRISGFLAWLAWLFIHLMKIVQFQNRVLVFIQWAAHYLTWNRAARLITGRDAFPFRGKQ
jgi:NADH:ubiquinone reductase (H+-translocating)